MKTILTCLLGLTLITMSVNAQSFDRALLDSYFDSLAHHDQAMGSLSIYRGGKEVYARAIGSADPERRVAATPHHTYRVGSITKTFTSVIIHKLAEAGLLSLDQKLDEYYSAIPNAGQITLDQMLRHQSGLWNYTNADDVDEWIGIDHPKAWYIERIEQSEPDFEPGKAVGYSNSNYLLLGYIAERVSNLSYPELLAKYITTPLGLERTYYGGAYDAGKLEATSFSPVGEGWKPGLAWSMTAANAAGAISSTAGDLNTFYGALFRGELLSETDLEQMTALREGMGRGIFSTPFGTKEGLGHNGGIEAFQTLAAHFPDDDVTVTYLGNGVRHPVNSIVIDVLTIYFGLPFEMPDLTPVPDLPVAEVEPLVGTYGKDDFPLDIKIFIEAGKLHAQATGQSAFPLTPAGKNEFVFEPAGIRLQFKPSERKMTLLQAGMVIEMTAEQE